jgi:hypothetical protein
MFFDPFFHQLPAKNFHLIKHGVRLRLNEPDIPSETDKTPLLTSLTHTACIFRFRTK